VKGKSKDWSVSNVSLQSNYLVPIRKQNLGTSSFPIQKWMIFHKFKEIKGLCGGVHMVRRTSNPAD